MRVKRRSRRTPFLLGVVAVLVAANVWWFGAQHKAPVGPAFQLADADDDGIKAAVAGISRKNIDGAPLYDASNNRWTVAGTPVSNLEAYFLPTGRAERSARFIIARLPDTATTDDVRRVLLDLTRRGICLVALPDDAAPTAINVRRIASVRDDSGRALSCPS